MMDLKIICLNIWQGGNLMPGILKFLGKENADILMLQEVYNGTDLELPDNYRSITVFKEAFDYDFYDFTPAMIDIVPEGKVVGGNAVFSKFPLAPHGSVFFNEPFRERQAHDPKEFPTAPRSLQHVTVALPSGTDLNIFNFQGVWDIDGDNYSEKRKKMSDIIINAVKDTPNVVLAGDTNAKPTNKAIIRIEDYLKSVFGNELQTSFNMRRKDNPGYATAFVDMMFLSKNIDVLSHECRDIDISDHLPLIVTIHVD